MNPSPASPRRVFLTFCQTLFFVFMWIAADFCARRSGIRIPGAVLGLGFVLVLLFAGVLKPGHLELGAKFLLAEMILFFMPAFVAAMTYFSLFASQGLRLLAAVGLGTMLVMAGTVLIVDKVFRWESKRSPQANE